MIGSFSSPAAPLPRTSQSHTHTRASSLLLMLSSTLHFCHLLSSLSVVAFTALLFILHLADSKLFLSLLSYSAFFLSLTFSFFSSSLPCSCLSPNSQMALLKVSWKGSDLICVCVCVCVWEWWTAEERDSFLSRKALRRIWKGRGDIDSQSRGTFREVRFAQDPKQSGGYVFTDSLLIWAKVRGRDTQTERDEKQPLDAIIDH